MIWAGVRCVPRQRRAGEGVEDAAAGGAAIVEHRGAVAAVDVGMVVGLATRAGQPVGVEQPDELVIAGVLVHEVDDREVHRGVSAGVSGGRPDVLANPGAIPKPCLTEFAS